MVVGSVTSKPRLCAAWVKCDAVAEATVWHHVRRDVRSTASAAGLNTIIDTSDTIIDTTIHTPSNTSNKPERQIPGHIRLSQPRSPIALVLLLITLAACHEGPLSPSERRALDEAESRWAQHRPSAYTFEERLSCFCAPGVEAWTELTVRGDSIVASRAIEVARAGGQPVPLEYWSSVPRLFDIVRHAAREDVVADVLADYDADYGYPRRIVVHCKDNVLDCGTIYEARKLKPLP